MRDKQQLLSDSPFRDTGLTKEAWVIIFVVSPAPIPKQLRG